jgi:aminoacylase
MQKFLDFRDSEERRLKTNQKEVDGKYVPLTLGDVTSVNITILSGGVQHNVIPNKMEIGVDIRVSPTMNLGKFRKLVESWISEAGCTFRFIQYAESDYITPLNNSNPLWTIIKNVSRNWNIQLNPEIFPAGSDSRFLRKLGIPTIGISPIRKTKVLLHDKDEFINENTFLEGIQWYKDVIFGIATYDPEREYVSKLMIEAVREFTCLYGIL